MAARGDLLFAQEFNLWALATQGKGLYMAAHLR
jgi:hypothetical protein